MISEYYYAALIECKGADEEKPKLVKIKDGVFKKHVETDLLNPYFEDIEDGKLYDIYERDTITLKGEKYIDKTTAVIPLERFLDYGDFTFNERLRWYKILRAYDKKVKYESKLKDIENTLINLDQKVKSLGGKGRI